MTDSDTITGLLVTALENVWAVIRSRHPDVPEVVLTVGAGSTGGSDLTLGEELGLALAYHPQLGWSVTTVPDLTQQQYSEVLDELAFALVAYRRREPNRRGGRTSSNNGLSAACTCGRKIRVSRTTLAAGPIYCGTCGGEFVTEGEPEGLNSVQIEFTDLSSR
ncbi:hypothetical protein ACWEOI_18960 [Nocardia sp. NPDC004340]